MKTLYDKILERLKIQNPEERKISKSKNYQTQLPYSPGYNIKNHQNLSF